MSGMAITALWASEFSNGIQANATCRLHRAAFHRTPRRISLARISNGLIKGIGVLACKEERQLRKLLAVKFSSTDSQESAAGLNRESEVDDKGRNPPVLTIIAGIVVFLLFSWVLGSIVLFIVGLFLK